MASFWKEVKMQSLDLGMKWSPRMIFVIGWWLTSGDQGAVSGWFSGIFAYFEIQRLQFHSLFLPLVLLLWIAGGHHKEKSPEQRSQQQELTILLKYWSQIDSLQKKKEKEKKKEVGIKKKKKKSNDDQFLSSLSSWFPLHFFQNPPAAQPHYPDIPFSPFPRQQEKSSSHLR